VAVVLASGRFVVQEVDDAIDPWRWRFQLALPDCEHAPAEFSKLTRLAGIARDSRGAFETPKLGVGRRHHSPVFALVGMPKASVHENDFSSVSKHQIRPPWEVTPMKAVPKSRRVQCAPQHEFRFRVFSANVAHIEPPLRDRKNVNHGETLRLSNDFVWNLTVPREAAYE
jgi:hypothetical protein